MKSNNPIKILGVVAILFIIIFIYSSFNGNPVGYINAKNNISEYIENNIATTPSILIGLLIYYYNYFLYIHLCYS